MPVQLKQFLINMHKANKSGSKILRALIYYLFEANELELANFNAIALNQKYPKELDGFKSKNC